ncbi:unnamed protein product [Miscanthus lutarioriparius]|uniref:J domain-containing protein n=1 Tax=Miscanthus lutarioriparius TaxID=422564 RepID=A0A811MNV5_9POAL|nr:unnamed protein product [Miscanthus lutarioriparius]
MATSTEEAEKAFRSSEERFLVDDLDGALRVVRNAKRHLASLPALQSALAAYEVHAAARGGRNCWYAVLGVGQPEPVTQDHDAIKKRYRRLCLVLHPDKNRSAAADGAFKLLQRAWEVLSARHPPGTGSGPGPGPGPKPRPPPAGAPDPDWWSSFLPQLAAAGRSARPRPQRVVVVLPLQAAARAHLIIVRLHAAAALLVGVLGQLQRVAVEVRAQKGHRLLRALRLGVRVRRGRRPPRHARRQVPFVRHSLQSAAAAAEPGGGCLSPAPAATAAEPPPRDPPPRRRQRDDDEREKFTCPAECSRCKTPFSSLVSRGMCELRCQACSYDAFVYVYDRHRAIAF